MPTDQATTQLVWPLFISYRRGQVTEAIADWLQKGLHQQVIDAVTGQQAILDVYLDRRRPVQMNFGPDLTQYLEQSRALLFILDSSACKRKGSGASTGDTDDYLYHELDWWRSQGRVPIILETDREVGRLFVQQTDFAVWKDVPRCDCYWLEWQSQEPAEISETKYRKLDEIKQKIRDLGIFRELEEKRKLRRRLRMAQIAAVLAMVAAIFAVYFLRDSQTQASNFNGARHNAEGILANLDDKVFKNRAAMGNIAMLEPLTHSAVEYFERLPVDVVDAETEQAYIDTLLNQAQVTASMGRFDDSAALLKRAKERVAKRSGKTIVRTGHLDRLLNYAKECLQRVKQVFSRKALSKPSPNETDRQGLIITIVEAQSLMLQRKYEEALILLRKTSGEIISDKGTPSDEKSSKRRQDEAVVLYLLAGCEALTGKVADSAKYLAAAESIDPNAKQELGYLFPNPYLQGLNQAMAIASTSLSDPAKAAERVQESSTFTDARDENSSDFGRLRQKANQLDLLGMTQARARTWETALESYRKAEEILRLLLQTEPHNPALHDQLVDVLLHRFEANLAVESRSASRSVEELKSIETYIAEHHSDFLRESLVKQQNVLLGDWGMLARRFRDKNVMTEVRDKLMTAVPVSGNYSVVVGMPEYGRDQWERAALRWSLASILLELSQKEEAIKYLDADLALWNTFFANIEAGKSGPDNNMHSLVRSMEAAMYSRTRAFVQWGRDNKEALLWFKRAILSRGRSNAADIDAATRRDARREMVELSIYAVQVCNSLDDFAQGRDIMRPALGLLKEGIGDDRVALLISGNLHIAFAAADMSLSKERTAAGLESVVEASKIVTRLKKEFADDAAARDVIASFNSLVETLRP